MVLSRIAPLARLILPDLLDPRAHRADRAAAARILDRSQSTPVSALPLHRALPEAVARLLEPAPGPLLLDRLVDSGALPPAAVSHLLDSAPGLEPQPRGPRRFVTAPHSDRSTRRTGRVRQGRLGDCWLIAVLAACESVAPGFLARLIRPVGETDLIEVALHAPRLAAPALRRLPLLPVRRRSVLLSTRVPTGHRAGDSRLRPAPVSLVEKAAVVAWESGSYRRLQNDFAGIGLALVTGRWCPARPVPRSPEVVGTWLDAGRPVVLSTLARPGGSFELQREDGAGTIAVMDAHVYVAQRVLRCDEDGRPGADRPRRLHVRNPVGGPESRTRRRTDLYLSAQQMRRVFISANVGPVLADL